MKKTHKYLAIIPARGGSKAIPRKNLVKLRGAPLISYTFKAALKSRLLDRILLTTDDRTIAALGKKYGIDVPFLRPKELSGDKAIMEGVMMHTLDWLRTKENYVPYAVILLQPTSPLRTTRHIDEAIELLEKKKADSIVSVSLPMEHPCDMVQFKNRKMLLLAKKLGLKKGKQRQQYPQYYFINGALYIFKTSILYKYGSRFGKTVVPYMMKQIESIDIDSWNNLKIAEAIIKDINRKPNV